MKNKLNKIVSLCKCEISIIINSHKNNYCTISEYLKEQIEFDMAIKEDTKKEILEEIIKRDFIIEMFIYNDTSVGFYRLLHYDFDSIFDEAIEILGAGI